MTTRLAAAFLLAAVLPSYVAVTVLFDHFARDAETRTFEALEDSVQNHEALLAKHIGALRSTAASLAAAAPVRDYLEQLDTPLADVPGALAEDLLHVTQGQQWGATHHIFLADATGRIVISPPRGEYEEPCRAPAENDAELRERLGVHLGESLGDREFFAEALTNSGVTTFSAFAERDHLHQLVFHPVTSEGGEPLGAVVVEVVIDSLIDLLEDGFIGRQGRVTLASRDGTRVIQEKAAEPERLESPGLREAIRTGSPIHGRYSLARGEVFGFYRPSTVYPWVTCVEIDCDEALSAVSEMRAATWRALGVAALGLGVLGWCIGRWFSRPLRRCASAALSVSEGNLDEPIEPTHGEDEIGWLERALERMRARLQEQIRTLDERVERKTTELRSALEAARSSEERYAQSVRGSRDALWDWDLETDEVYFAPRWAELLGCDEEDLGTTPDWWRERILPEDRGHFEECLQRHLEGEAEFFDLEFQMLHADGSLRTMMCRGAAARDGQGRALRIAGSLADMTEARRATEELNHLAHHDRLTGLPNRTLFHERLRTAISRQRRYPEREFAVLFFDFDRFKVINDSLGHDVGDEVLVAIAARFRENMRAGDVASRFGGDEFAVLLSDVRGPDEARSAAERFLEVFEEPYTIEHNEVTATASIGLVMGGSEYDSPDEMIRDADAAMYQAKSAGKARVCMFDAAMHEDALRRLSLEQDLRRADFDEQFFLLYQPIICVDTNEVAGFEALVRWRHPEKGRLSPDQFIPIAEETGLIVPLGEWILRTACRQLVEWRERLTGSHSPYMNVNLSRKQLTHPSLLPTLDALSVDFEFPAGALRLEVTESTVMDSRHDMLDVMQAVRDRGFPLAMDDFGTGYSSLSCLHTFPLDVLKIDKTFVDHLVDQPDFTAIVQGILTLANHLGLEVVAEGIEEPEQLAQLTVLGCKYVQGYLFSEPLEPDGAWDLLLRGVSERGAA